MNRTGLRLLASALVGLLALALASCGGGGATSTATTGNAQIRFINGSPDAGPIDILINGKAVVTNLTYSQISAYQTVLVGTTPLPQVGFVQTGTQINIFAPTAGGTAQTFQLGAAPSSKLTIVIEGRAKVVGSAGLNLGAFIEPTIQNSTGTYAIVFHHASPLASLASPNGLVVGQIALGSSPAFSQLGVMLFSSSGGSQQSFFGLTSQPAINGPPGIGFYVGPVIPATATPIPVISSSPTPSPSPSPSGSPTPVPVPTPTVYAAIVPGPAITIPAPNLFPVSGVDPSDVNQSIPFGANDTSLFVYAIDSTMSSTGVILIGTFNN